MAEKEARWQRLSPPGVKAGERIRTADVQLGKPCRVPELLFSKHLTEAKVRHSKACRLPASH